MDALEHALELRRQLIDDYAWYVESFPDIADERVRTLVDDCLTQGLVWPEPHVIPQQLQIMRLLSPSSADLLASAMRRRA